MIRTLIPWATSAGTLLGMWLLGQKRSIGWIVGLVNQVLWITFAVMFEAWGLLPLTCALVVIYSRNLARWRREDRHAAELLAEGVIAHAERG